jgi:hypothetical protein
MAQRPRIHYKETQRAVMWDRWQRGESLHEVAKLFDRHPFIGATDIGGERRHTTDTAPSLGACPDVGRARRDLADHRGGADRSAPWPCICSGHPRPSLAPATRPQSAGSICRLRVG